MSFAGGLPDSELWRGWELPAIDASAYQYGPSEGEYALREVFARSLVVSGLDCEASQVVVTSGSQQGLDLAAKLLVAPRDLALVESPTYLAALQVFRLFQADVEALPLAASGIDPEALDEALNRRRPSLIYLNPTYQNPTGACYSEERRRAVAELIDRHGLILVEDDPYRELSYETRPPPPIASYLRRASWIYLGSVSKTLLPGLRIGYLAASRALLDPLVKLKQAADLHTSRLCQDVALKLLADEESHRRRILRAREWYRIKRDRMHATLERHSKGLALWRKPQGGMFFWLQLDRPVDLGAALERALEKGIAFMPGDPFLSDESQHGRCLRLNFSQPKIDEIEGRLPELLESVQ